MFAAAYDNWLGLGAGALILVLLVVALLAPERF